MDKSQEIGRQSSCVGLCQGGGEVDSFVQLLLGVQENLLKLCVKEAPSYRRVGTQCGALGSVVRALCSPPLLLGGAEYLCEPRKPLCFVDMAACVLRGTNVPRQHVQKNKGCGRLSTALGSAPADLMSHRSEVPVGQGEHQTYAKYVRAFSCHYAIHCTN